MKAESYEMAPKWTSAIFSTKSLKQVYDKSGKNRHTSAAKQGHLFFNIVDLQKVVITRIVFKKTIIAQRWSSLEVN